MPDVVIVSGLPAAGKSTLAKRLCEELGLVRVERDRLSRDVLGEVARVVPDSDRHRVARAKDRLVNAVASAAVDAGSGVVIDGNFNAPEQADSIRSWLDMRSLRAEVCLWGDPSVLERRFVLRADPPLTDELRPYFHGVLHRPRWTVLSHPALVFHADTTEFARLDAEYPRLVAALRDALAETT